MEKLLYILNKILPKKNIIIFNSFPDISGNSLALYMYIVKCRQDILKKYRLIWTIGSIELKEASVLLDNKVDEISNCIVRKKSLKGILIFLLSKYIVTTHGYFPGISSANGQKHINLWHGMPFKRIGKMLEDVHTNGKNDEADVTIATSKVFQDIMAQSFGIGMSNVLITGQPCNDFLYHKESVLDALLTEKKKYNKIIVWMPTYRKSVIGDIRQDGSLCAFGIRDIIENYYDELHACLTKNNYVLLIKPHPMDELANLNVKKSAHIIFVNDNELKKNNITLYEMLGCCDVLLTDYSSVYIDFMVTGKPIAFVCDDLCEYESTRGFCFDNPRNYMPGELITDFAGFLDYIDRIDEFNEKWKDKYNEIRNIFHKFTDSNSSERVSTILWGEKND